MTQANTQLALVKKNVVDVVSQKIREFQGNKELMLPPGYSPDNAMKSAFLILQNTVDNQKNPVLQSCTQNSIANSLLDMVVQGLNPAKKQCYFIAYGKNLVCMRSYHGAVAVVKSLCGAVDVFSQVVWKGDEFEYSIERGNKGVVTHKQKLENVGKDPLAVYCIIEFPEGREYTDIMTMDQVRNSWKKSKMNPNKDGSTHKEFPEEMIRRTVINRACKKYINASSDNALLLERFNRAEGVVAEVEFKEEVSENANAELIDIGTGEVLEAVEGEPLSVDLQTGEDIQPEQEAAVAGGPGF